MNEHSDSGAAQQDPEKTPERDLIAALLTELEGLKWNQRTHNDRREQQPSYDYDSKEEQEIEEDFDGYYSNGEERHVEGYDEYGYMDEEQWNEEDEESGQAVYCDYDQDINDEADEDQQNEEDREAARDVYDNYDQNIGDEADGEQNEPGLPIATQDIIDADPYLPDTMIISRRCRHTLLLPNNEQYSRRHPEGGPHANRRDLFMIEHQSGAAIVLDPRDDGRVEVSIYGELHARKIAMQLLADYEVDIGRHEKEHQNNGVVEERDDHGGLRNYRGPWRGSTRGRRRERY